MLCSGPVLAYFDLYTKAVLTLKCERDSMRIKKHEKSYIVELEDDSAWRIWPCDLLTSLHWMPTTRFEVSEIDDDHCTHALIDRANGMRVRVIEAAAGFAPEQIEASLIS